jgi:glycine hydroxymethyltransferase
MPLMHVIAAKAVAFKEAMTPEFKEYQAQTVLNARVIAQGLVDRGYSIVSGGTDNHLFLLDLVDKDITGKAADAALGAANITVNKNAVPNDPRSPFVTSGIRIGSPAVTRRGFKEAECLQLANWIADVLDDIDNEETNKAVQAKVVELCRRFPVYPKSA